ncbi:unnamed protein product, partial [Protopolystoma xenopodis]
MAAAASRLNGPMLSESRGGEGVGDEGVAQFPGKEATKSPFCGSSPGGCFAAGQPAKLADVDVVWSLDPSRSLAPQALDQFTEALVRLLDPARSAPLLPSARSTLHTTTAPLNLATSTPAWHLPAPMEEDPFGSYQIQVTRR